jgi:hypothetical protein
MWRKASYKGDHAKHGGGGSQSARHLDGQNETRRRQVQRECLPAALLAPSPLRCLLGAKEERHGAQHPLCSSCPGLTGASRPERLSAASVRSPASERAARASAPPWPLLKLTAVNSPTGASSQEGRRCSGMDATVKPWHDEEGEDVPPPLSYRSRRTPHNLHDASPSPWALRAPRRKLTAVNFSLALSRRAVDASKPKSNAPEAPHLNKNRSGLHRCGLVPLPDLVS